MIKQEIKPFEFDDIKFNSEFKCFSECGKFVIVVGKKADGTYTYQLSGWTNFESESGDYSYWVEKKAGGIYQDFINALNEAKKELKVHEQKNS